MKDDIKVGYSKNYTTIVAISNINFNDEKAIIERINDFADRFKYADVEHALEISPTGKAYTLKGIHGYVSPEMLGKDILKGSIGIHNHPLKFGQNMGDSFSDYDLAFAAEYKLGK